MLGRTRYKLTLFYNLIIDKIHTHTQKTLELVIFTCSGNDTLVLRLQLMNIKRNFMSLFLKKKMFKYSLLHIVVESC